MAYWWVSQGRTFRQENMGGYLWAPTKGKNDTTYFHWTNLTLVQPGDIIFSYVREAISAVAVASSAAYSASRPSEILQPWHYEGYRVDAQYTLVAPTLPIAGFLKELMDLLPDRYSPLTSVGTGMQGYLFALPDRAAHLIRRELKPYLSVEDVQTNAIGNESLPDTTRTAIIEARIGQGQWRSKLLHKWDGRCAVSNLDAEPLLRASHIKPWRDSNNIERLDIYNGLLLGPSYDAAFDIGLITFDENGKLLTSPGIDTTQLRALGISASDRLRTIEPKYQEFLAYHRKVVFRPKN